MMNNFHSGKTATGSFRSKGNKMKKFIVTLGLAVLGLVGSASAVAPIDVTDVSTEVLPYITAAAGAGLLVFGALYAIRVIIKAFRAAGK
jgi:hypothetical protein